MKLRQFVSVINMHNLIEIVDRNYIQLFYGQVKELSYGTVISQFSSCQVLAANCFEAEINPGTFVPTLQIVINTEV